MKTFLQRTVSVLISLLTTSAFVYYLWRHPGLVHQLRNTPLHVLALLLLLYLAWFGALGLSLHATLRICGTPLPIWENVQLNVYSTLVNFFIPGQGGIAVRGLYMKRIYHLPLSRYLLATLLYYMCYAIISAVMLLIYSRPWWQSCLGIGGAIIGGVLVLSLYERRANVTMADGASPANIAFLVMTTFCQVAAQALVFGVELWVFHPDVLLSQVVTYTGAANFSVFVALTPGAIGIRESFLVLTGDMHHIRTVTIMAASVLDRAVFLVFLGLLFLLSRIFHVRKQLGL